jgi:hypothetical protein
MCWGKRGAQVEKFWSDLGGIHKAHHWEDCRACVGTGLDLKQVERKEILAARENVWRREQAFNRMKTLGALAQSCYLSSSLSWMDFAEADRVRALSITTVHDPVHLRPSDECDDALRYSDLTRSRSIL